MKLCIWSLGETMLSLFFSSSCNACGRIYFDSYIFQKNKQIKYQQEYNSENLTGNNGSHSPTVLMKTFVKSTNGEILIFVFINVFLFRIMQYCVLSIKYRVKLYVY